MKKEELRFGDIPGLLYTVQSDRAFLFVHGKGGNKEEASLLAEIACEKGWDVVGIDLPGWGERTAEAQRFVPWEAAPELRAVYDALKQRYSAIALFANSIGAYFLMHALGGRRMDRAYFISPIVNMEKLICDMMKWANVTEAELEQRKIIPTDFGEELSWEYLCYVRAHPLNWQVPTSILYGEKDNLTSIETMRAFAEKQGASLTVMKDGEHWFHTEEEMKFLDEWIGRQK